MIYIFSFCVEVLPLSKRIFKGFELVLKTAVSEIQLCLSCLCWNNITIDRLFSYRFGNSTWSAWNLDKSDQIRDNLEADSKVMMSDILRTSMSWDMTTSMFLTLTALTSTEFYLLQALPFSMKDAQVKKRRKKEECQTALISLFWSQPQIWHFNFPMSWSFQLLAVLKISLIELAN